MLARVPGNIAAALALENDGAADIDVDTTGNEPKPIARQNVNLKEFAFQCGQVSVNIRHG